MEMQTKNVPWHARAKAEWNNLYGDAVIFLGNFKAWYKYDGGVFEEYPNELIDRDIFRVIDLAGEPETDRHLNLFKKKLKGWKYRSLKEFDSPEYLNCKNGLLHMETKRFDPHSSKYLSLHQLPVEYLGEPQPTPAWDRVKKAYPKPIDHLERMIQAALHQDYSNEALIFLVGETGSGKGTAIQIVEAMFGKWCSHTPLTDVGEDFGLSRLMEARVNIDRDMEIANFSRKTVRILKDIVTGEGESEIRIKYIKQFDWYLQVWFFSASNQLGKLPSGTDRGAWFRRVLICVMNETQKRDPGFKQQVLEEASKIFTNLVLQEYEPIINSKTDIKKMIEDNAELWDYWSQPVLRICHKYFAKSEDPDDSLDSTDVYEWVDAALVKKSIAMHPDHCKREITMVLGKMGIRKVNRTRYRPITIIDETLLERVKEEKKGVLQDTLEKLIEKSNKAKQQTLMGDDD